MAALERNLVAQDGRAIAVAERRGQRRRRSIRRTRRELLREEPTASPSELLREAGRSCRGAARGPRMERRRRCPRRSATAIRSGLRDEIPQGGLLYVWVSPRNPAQKHEAHRSTTTRLHPPPRVPDAVMFGNYGCDDMMAIEHSGRPDTVRSENARQDL